ncbi:SHOCT domain-containing protein [Cellulomonas sp. ACRRI]|uniref:SHOCT domain-containing protein n=1 Tax=Cellulomonas sp. ACRRI TaxID=2918188 RepID=UPI001EF2BF37|nr:SHOCT domain-containing protein [Cellulomonas sp. ACRRI]MCG7286622.1 SHOCT domain-containing protein [Cellulomonas sp. ACRRI]
MSAAPDVPSALSGSAARTAVTAAVAAGLGVLAWWLLRLGAHDATLVRWECFAGTCATDDFAGAAPVLGGIALLATAAVAWPVARRATPGLAAVLGSGALLTGWSAAVSDGLTTDQAVRRPVLIAALVLALGLVAALWGGVRTLRDAGGLLRLRGRTGTWARVQDYESVPGPVVGATVHFDDARGVRHAVRTRVPRAAFAHPPRAYYDPERPDDPQRLAVVVPPPPLTAAARRARERAVRGLLPLPDDDLAGGDAAGAARGPDRAGAGEPGRRASGAAAAGGARPSGGASVVDALERLQALRATGALSEEEYVAAKARVLGG